MNKRLLEATLWRLTWKLWRHGVPGHRRRAIRGEMRGNLYALAADIGEENAVKRLGDLDQLAAEFAASNADRRNTLSLVGGMWWAIAALFVLALLNGLHLMTRNGIEDRAEFDPYRHALTIGKYVLIRIYGNVEQGLLLHIEVTQLAYFIIPLAAFLVGLRPWRLLIRAPGPRASRLDPTALLAIQAERASGRGPRRRSHVCRVEVSWETSTRRLSGRCR